ncbi:MAG: CAP domain-containing protein [Bacteroidales bacterium]|nr:CAP domain-containing protein [Bacteroidales bacterium]
MREKHYILFFLLLPQLLAAQFPYQRLVDKGLYEKAFAKAEKIIEEKPNNAEANYNYAQLCYLYCQNNIIDLSYGKLKHNIDKAYLLANKTKFLKDLSPELESNLNTLQQNICDFAYELAELKNDVEDYNVYIEQYISCPDNIAKAKNEIIEKAFFSTKVQNTISAYKNFIEEFTGSQQALIAQELQNKLIILAEQERIAKQKLLKVIDENFIKDSVLNESKIFSTSKEINKQKLILLINNVRTKGCKCGTKYYHPVKRLKWSNKLEQAAKLHSNDMLNMKNMTHFGSDLSSPSERIVASGYNCSSCGENIAKGQEDEETVFKSWLRSVPHCTAIMNPYYTEMGAAVSGYYWTLDFASPYNIDNKRTN